MNKILLAMLSGLLISGSAYADDEHEIVESNTLKFLGAPKITEEASAEYLKNSGFRTEEDSFAKDATIIHNRLTVADGEGQPFLFAFNEGNRIVGVASSYDSSNSAFFENLAKLDGVTCIKQKSRFSSLATCHHTSVKPETVKKFQRNFKILMENAG